MNFVDYGDFYRDLKTHGPAYAAQRAARLGFAGVELLHTSRSTARWDSPMPAAEIRKILDANGLFCACCSLEIDLSSHVAPERLETVWCLIEDAAVLGASYFHHTLVPTLNPADLTVPYRALLERIFPYALQIANRCADYGITCLYEPQGVCFNGVEGLGGFYRRIAAAAPNVGICGDVGNGLFADTSAKEIYNAFLPAIRHVHLKDYRVSDVPFEGARTLRSRTGNYLCECPLGEGVTDFSYCFDALRRVGYTGAFSFEFNGSDEAILDAMDFVRHLYGAGQC